VLGVPPHEKLGSYFFDRAVMFFGQAVEKDLDRAMDQGKRKKPLSEHERETRRREVFSRWFNKKIERKYRDPAAGRT
jgi:hypothetical protein